LSPGQNLHSGIETSVIHFQLPNEDSCSLFFALTLTPPLTSISR
jgi:hypothetical protein